MYLDNVLHKPKLSKILRCLAQAILMKLKENSLVVGKRIIPIYEEDHYPVVHYREEEVTGDCIYEYLYNIFFIRRLTAECAVIAVVYIDKLIQATLITFHPGNWRIIVWIALLLVNKMWADLEVWNEDFLSLYADLMLSVNDVCKLESEFLKALNFEMHVLPSMYSKYYFKLRRYMNYTGELPGKPMDNN